MKAFFFNLISKLASLIKSQRIWEAVHTIVLRQMNFGTSGDFKQTGELFVINFIFNLLKDIKTLTIFDVGANSGKYALAISEIFDSRAEIHAFEPSKKTFESLAESCQSVENIIVNNFGLSDKENKQLLFSDNVGSSLASVYERNLGAAGINMNLAEEIELTTIDLYCSKNRINEIHFLKLDVEGHELSVLNGAATMIKNGKIRFIQFEFGGCNLDSRTYFKDFFCLLNEDYKIYRILEKGLYEIRSYKEQYEVFLNVNYLAIKR